MEMRSNPGSSVLLDQGSDEQTNRKMGQGRAMVETIGNAIAL